MYKLSLVKKKKKVRRAAIITSIGAIGVTAMVIVAFLGRSVGTFTINLHGDGVKLALSQHSSFEDQTTNLVCRDLKSFSGQQTVKYFEGDYSYEELHNEETASTIGQEKYGNVITNRFFKYTFFIKNVGEYAASYDMDIKFTEKVEPTNGAAPLDEYLRLAVFDGEGNLDPTYYARRSLTRKLNGEGIVPEYVTVDDPDSDVYAGIAETFVDDDTLAKITKDIAVNEVHMYTFLFWLEGYDPESTAIPDKASLRIGANINAYHQKDTQE